MQCASARYLSVLLTSPLMHSSAVPSVPAAKRRRLEMATAERQPSDMAAEAAAPEAASAPPGSASPGDAAPAAAADASTPLRRTSGSGTGLSAVEALALADSHQRGSAKVKSK